MRRKPLLMLLLALPAAGILAAPAEPLSAWGKGPVQFFMTREETAAWKSAGDDQAAQALIDLFWARRDPTPDTPRNEFREDLEARIKYADEHFGSDRQRGALSDRGKILLLFGAPARVTRAALEAREGFARPGMGPDEARGVRETWLYDGPQTTAMFGQARIEIVFEDNFGSGDLRMVRSFDLAAAQQRAITASLVQPGLAKVAAIAPAAPKPPQMRAFRTPAFEEAVAQFKTSKGAGLPRPSVSWTEAITPGGELFVPVELYLPKLNGIAAGDEVTFFAAIDDSSGTSVAAIEAPVTVASSKGVLFVDKSLSIPAGKHPAYLGIAKAGKPLAMAQAELEVSAAIDPTASGISTLILSNDVYPLDKPQAPTDPFAYGGVKVVPKGDRTFSKADDLWYFFELRNPGVEEGAAGPRVQVRVELEGTTLGGRKVERLSPYSEVAAQALKGVPGHYGVGSSMPLSNFAPGDYTIKLRVTDTVTKQTYNLQQTFKIVG